MTKQIIPMLKDNAQKRLKRIKRNPEAEGEGCTAQYDLLYRYFEIYNIIISKHKII